MFLRILFLTMLGFITPNYSLNIPGSARIHNTYTLFRNQPLWKQLGITIASVYTASLISHATIILADKAGSKWAHKINKEQRISESWDGAFQRISTFLFT